MIASYLGSIGKWGPVMASSLQPNMSAINTMHTDCGFKKPAVGRLVQSVRRGLSHTQVVSTKNDTRIPLPAEVVASVLLDSERVRRAAAGNCLAPQPWAELLRRCYAFVLSLSS